MFTAISLPAQKYDYQWIFGYSDNEEHRFGITLLDFNNGDVDVAYYRGSQGYDLDFGGSFIDNRKGEIILHTNNCVVRDTNWNIISGDSLITPTGTAAQTCTDGGNTYGSNQCSIFLPDLKDSSIIYLIHKDSDIDFDAQDIYTNNMWISTIKKEASGFVYYSTKLICDKKQKSQILTACPNRSKTGWWILMPDNRSNVFRKYLIANDTVIYYPKQVIGIDLKAEDIDIGQAQYSPDGSMLGINSEEHGVLLYDFDNETGELSNFRNIPYPDSKHVAQGMCFSPNNRFIYVTTAENVYQIDLQENNEVYHVGHYRSFDGDHWPVGLGMIFSGPDCRLYVSPGSTTYYLHVILNPDEKGEDCNFVERAIELPSNLPNHLPNLPQYRYLTGCDTGIEFPFSTSILDEVLQKTEFKIYPNPASDYIEVVLTKMGRWRQWRIIDFAGQKVLDGRYNDMEKIDISGLSQGMYFLQLIDKSGNVRIGKFVVE